MRTLEQRRAAHALARVESLRHCGDGLKTRYRAYVDRLGPAIVMNGLGQALATERAAAGANPAGDEGKVHLALYESLQEWLCGDGGVYRGKRNLLDAIVNHDESRYLHAQAEALAWLEWHKKCCRAALPREEGGSE